jgi:hypothetical protein
MYNSENTYNNFVLNSLGWYLNDSALNASGSLSELSIPIYNIFKRALMM